MHSTLPMANQPLETSRAWHWGALAFAALFPTLGTWVYFIALTGHEWMQGTYAAAKIVQFAFPLVWVLVVQKARPAWPFRTSGGVGFGVVFGAIIFTAMCGFYFGVLRDTALMRDVAAGVTQKIADARLLTPARFIGLAVFYSLFHSLAEEYYWRWFVYGQLRRVTSQAPANVVSSLAFMAHHVLVVWTYMQDEPAAVVVFSLAVAVGGSVWAWLYERSGSLLGPWLSHLLVDAAIMVVGYAMIWGS